MFTGLIEEVGQVLRLSTSSAGGRLEVSSSLNGIKLGDSVAVNGACLTVVSEGESYLSFEVSQETLLRTNLRFLKRGDRVNLERAMRADSRLDGHLVLGHVDFTARIRSFKNVGEHRELVVELPADYEVYVVEKGSIALDGISLTINYVREGELSINVIPHTYENTNLAFKREGDLLNVELDILGKYVVNYLRKVRAKSSEDKIREFFGL